MFTLEKFKDVPSDVINDVKEYLEKNHLGELVDVRRKSYNPKDHYLYMVVAKNGDNFSCWTAWNQSTKGLHHGHYCLPNLARVYSILDEYSCMDISEKFFVGHYKTKTGYPFRVLLARHLTDCSSEWNEMQIHIAQEQEKTYGVTFAEGVQNVPVVEQTRMDEICEMFELPKFEI